LPLFSISFLPEEPFRDKGVGFPYQIMRVCHAVRRWVRDLTFEIHSHPFFQSPLRELQPLILPPPPYPQFKNIVVSFIMVTLQPALPLSNLPRPFSSIVLLRDITASSLISVLHLKLLQYASFSRLHRGKDVIEIHEQSGHGTSPPLFVTVYQ